MLVEILNKWYVEMIKINLYDTDTLTGNETFIYWTT